MNFGIEKAEFKIEFYDKKMSSLKLNFRNNLLFEKKFWREIKV